MRTKAIGCAPILLFGAAVGAIVGCGGAKLADPKAVALEELRLIAPFEQQQTLIATELSMTMTANFYSQLIQGTAANLHEAKVTPTDDGGTIYEFRPKLPGAPPMKFTIGKTRFLVEEYMKLSVLGGRHALTLDASARGVSWQRGEQKTHLRQVEIADGMFRRGR